VSEPSSNKPTSLEGALRRVLGEIRIGLAHGYFEYTLTCELANHGKRRLVLRAGKHYQFIIGADECETGRRWSDPHQEGAKESDV
jgi:hypothetical protein